MWSGIKRTHRMAPTKKAPTLTTVIAAMVEPLGERRIDVRDRALLLMGFAGAFRRSELVALDVEDITDTDDGLRIAVHRSKADQEGEGAAVGLPYGSNPATCPVRAWRAWLEVSEITEGPAFRAITRHDKAARPRISSRRLTPTRSPSSSSGGRRPRGSTRPRSPATPSVRGSPPRRSARACPSCR